MTRQIQQYIWGLPTWPQFRWSADALIGPLSEARRRQGELLGAVSRIGFESRRRASVEILTEDAIETSQIEGETLSRPAVHSSVARRLGIAVRAKHPSDARADGTADVMVDATRRHDEPLTSERLFRWHASLFPVELGDRPRITVGKFRDESSDPMQVVSSQSGHTTVHFEAPPAKCLTAEVTRFLDWFNTKQGEDGIIRSAIGHLWFVTLHPFDDGNGRISRAIGDMALAQDENSGDRFYSLSRQIRIDRARYYDILEATQKGDLSITAWLVWFFGCYSRAVESSHHILADVFRATRFWLSLIHI